MGCFKKLKWCKTTGNSRTGYIRSVVNGFLTCITRRSRSPSPEKSGNTKENTPLENSKETSNAPTVVEYEALINRERQLVQCDIHRVTHEEEKSAHILQVHDILFKQKKQGHRRGERGCLEEINEIQILDEGTFGQEFLSRKVRFDLRPVQEEFEFKEGNKILVLALVHAEQECDGPDESDGTSDSDSPLLEGPADKPQTAKCATVDAGTRDKLKKLAAAVAVAAVVMGSLLLIGNILYTF
jgi:hypothetical protein